MNSVSVAVAVLLWGFLVLLTFGFTDSYLQKGQFSSSNEPAVIYTYDRIDEVKKECGFVLNSASELKPDDGRVYNIKEGLSFVDGDWVQESGKAPILPFDDRGVAQMNSESPVNLVSFWVTDVDREHRSKKSISVSGFLKIGMTIDNTFSDIPYQPSPGFQIWHGNTLLSIAFEGIYMETKNKEERVICLLGNTMLPSREQGSPDPWEWVKDPGFNYNQPPLLQDDRILLVLRYPMSFTLTNRVIQGEMRSLNPNSNLKYFDEVHITSQLGMPASYEFGSKEIVSRACDPYPYVDKLMNGVSDVYKGVGFCRIFQQITQDGYFTVVPNWKCNDADEFCRKLGPFVSDKEIKATDGGFKDVRLVIQNVRCEETPGRRKDGSARVSAVFRVVPPLQRWNFAASRSGLNNMTVGAEGMWKSSSGQLCMVGCLGLVDAESSRSRCNSRICMYVPLSFSIKQRSVIFGSFSSLSEGNASYFPLSFEKRVQPMELWNYFRASSPNYSYSKIDTAGVILERNEAFGFGTVITKSLLKYPKLEEMEAYLTSLSLLSEDLTLQVSAVPDPFPRSQSRPPRTDLRLEILTLGPLFGRYWSSGNRSNEIEEEAPYHTKNEYTEKQLLLNVSAQLVITGSGYTNFSVVFLEGLYDQHVGKMYLVGCRDVRASWQILFESMDLEAGLDCLMEVIVSYPPTTSRWLVNPTAKISVASQRNEDDPLYFKPVKLQTVPIMYRRQREDILSRRGVEGILRILTLSLAISCITSQLFHIKHNTDSVPYMSLVMLGVQALGYSLPLVTGAEALFKKMASESYETSSYELEQNQWIHMIDYTVKLLVLTSFLLTLRLCQKLWKSRIRLLTREQPRRVPSDKLVLITTSVIHLIGYTIVLISHTVKTNQKPIVVENYGNSHKLWAWESELEEYIGLVQDFFLLPQVIGNFVWQIDCKPLGKLYFIGVTMVRLLPHAYDYIRSPTLSNPYFAEENEFVNPNMDFYSKFGDIAIPATAILLAAVIYVQQRWNYEKLSQRLAVGRWRLLPVGSRAYERLSSKASEAELVPGVVNGNGEDQRMLEDDL